MIKVRGKEYPWRVGMTLADLLRDMKDPYPYAVVRVNEKAVTRPHFETTAIPDSAEVFPIPMIAGG